MRSGVFGLSVIGAVAILLAHASGAAILKPAKLDMGFYQPADNTTGDRSQTR